MIGPDAQADAADRVALRILGAMSAAVEVGDEERIIWQFHRFAVAVGVVHEKAVILPGRNPRVAAVGAEDHPQAAVAGRVGTMQTDKCAVAQYVKTGRKHAETESHGRRPSMAIIARLRPGRSSPQAAILW